MVEQISIIDILDHGTESHFTTQIRRGSGFEGGRVRIYCASCNLGVKELAVFMKEEYGNGGNSITFSDGQSGFADYSGTGIELRIWKTHDIEKHSWLDAAKEVKRLIFSEEYLDKKDEEKVWQVSRHYGKLPVPKPRMAML